MTTDIIVIGGGVIGSAIAYNLTKRGKRVVLLEKKYLVNGASRGLRIREFCFSPKRREII